MDGEGCYYDTYITFDNKTLYLLSGYDRLVKNKKTFDTQFDFKDFSEYPMAVSYTHLDVYKRQSYNTSTFEITDAQKNGLVIGFVIVLPLLLIISGIVIWVKRLHK